MSKYNIEVEIFPDEGVIRVYSEKGADYTYDISSESGAELLSKIFGTNTRSTVYSQDEQMSLEEWESRYGEL